MWWKNEPNQLMLCYREKREVRETRKEGGKTRLSRSVRRWRKQGDRGMMDAGPLPRAPTERDSSMILNSWFTPEPLEFFLGVIK